MTGMARSGYSVRVEADVEDVVHRGVELEGVSRARATAFVAPRSQDVLDDWRDEQGRAKAVS